jgi:hypothetical protein
MKRFAPFFLPLFFILFTAAQLAAKDKFNTIAVHHFANTNGVTLSQDFINTFSDGLRSELEKYKVSQQAVGEGVTVADAVAADSLSIEGKFTGLDKGALRTKLSMEINIYRISDHALVKTLTTNTHFVSHGAVKNLGEVLGEETAQTIAWALRKISLSSIPLGPPVARPVPPGTMPATSSGTTQAAPPVFASVHFSSNPTGAEITIDGNYAGNTPSLIKLKPGAHSVKVTKKGYMPWVRSINTDAGESRNLAADLEKTNQ